MNDIYTKGTTSNEPKTFIFDGVQVEVDDPPHDQVEVDDPPRKDIQSLRTANSIRNVMRRPTPIKTGTYASFQNQTRVIFWVTGAGCSVPV
jgi:hypothetical protein